MFATIGMIGGAINQPTPEIISEYLPVTKLMSGGGGLGSLMKRVMSGGLASVAPNPMALIGGQAQGAIGQALGAVSGASGLGGLTGALGNLSGSVSGLLTAGAGLLSGQGALSVMSHANIASMVGSALPAGLGMGTVLGPLTAGGPLAAVAAGVPQVVSAVQAGTLTPTAAVAQVVSWGAMLDGITAASAHAMTTLDAMAPDIAGLSTVAAAFVSGPPEYRAVLEASIAPADRQIMAASVATHLDAD